MRIQIRLVIEMTDEQVAAYVSDYGLPVPVRAKDVVTHVQAEVLTSVRHSDAFGEVDGVRGADVSIKR